MVSLFRSPLIARPRWSCKIGIVSKLEGTHVAFGGGGHVSRGQRWHAGFRLCGDVRGQSAEARLATARYELRRNQPSHGVPGPTGIRIQPPVGRLCHGRMERAGFDILQAHPDRLPRGQAPVLHDGKSRRSVATMTMWILYRPPKAMPIRAMMARLACGSTVPK